jgi:hypothetical protein
MTTETIDIENKHVRYQFTAYVGFVHSGMSVLGEYETAINIIVKNLKETNTRLDVVAYPVLYMMRHSLEIGYKENILYLKKYSGRQANKRILERHDLNQLHLEFKEHFEAISTKLSFDNELTLQFYKYYDPTTQLIQSLEPTEASAFRYVTNVKGESIFNGTEKKDFGVIKGQYDNAITMLAHTADVISTYTDYVDLLTELPDFKNGTGQVVMTFASYELDNVTRHLDQKHEKVDKLTWKDKVDNQNLVIVTVDKKCYLLPIKVE